MLVDILLGHYMLTRSSNCHAAEISDLFTFKFKGEGPTRCMPLIFTTRAGKQNQHGQQSGPCVPQICGLVTRARSARDASCQGLQLLLGLAQIF